MLSGTRFKAALQAFAGDGLMQFDNIVLNTAQPVPEPESLALMLAGIGVVGLVVRRRRH